MLRRLCLALVLLLSSGGSPALAEAARQHGLSAFGDLKYQEGFPHFEYVQPDAPKGGEIRLWALDSFDSLNPFLLKGVAAEGLAYNGIAVESGAFVFESLMEPAADEPDSVYGLIAETAELAPGRSAVSFTLRPNARFHDGSPITAEDVVFSFQALVRDGHPRYRLLLRDVTEARAEGPHRVTFRFAAQAARDLPLLVARLPVLSKAWFDGRDFTRAALEPMLASGPYRIDQVDPGRSITYRRVADHWARDLPVYRGRHNFDTVRFDYYRDRDIALEAFFAGAYDFREEPTSKHWAGGYDRPPVHKGLIAREVLPDRLPSGVQGFFINARRPAFQDRRVRAALAHAYDFEWMNRTLFHGLYKRMGSMFANSELAAEGAPSPAELALLEPLRDRVPPEVFGPAFEPPATDGSGSARDNLRRAQALLAEAGWVVRDGSLVHRETGAPMRIEFLLFEGVYQRVVAPFARNLERLGIGTEVRLVDVAAFQNRMESFDYDIIIRRFPQPLTPGIEQRNYWGSSGADTSGSLNFAGVRDPAVDALVEHVVAAGDRPSLIAATRALDRALTWGWYVVPHFYSGTFKIAYWNKFGRPAVKPAYALGHLDTWWIDPARSASLAAGIAPPDPAPIRH